MRVPNTCPPVLPLRLEASELHRLLSVLPLAASGASLLGTHTSGATHVKLHPPNYQQFNQARSCYPISFQPVGNRAVSKCHKVTGFLSWVGAKTFIRCKAVGGGCSAAAQPCTALPAAQQWGGCSAKNGLFLLQLRCFPPPLFSCLCMGAVLRRGNERQRKELHVGQAAAPHLKHCSALGSPCRYKGEQDPRVGEVGKALLACGGEGGSKERCLKGLCLSWAAFARLGQRRHPLLSASCFRLPSLWQPLLVPFLSQVGCCPLSGPGCRLCLGTEVPVQVCRTAG